MYNSYITKIDTKDLKHRFLISFVVIIDDITMVFCNHNCRFGTALTCFTILVLWTICTVPTELAYLYAVWIGASCSNEVWKYLATVALTVSTLGLVLFIALTGGLIISVQQKEYKIETLKKLIARRVRHPRRRTRGSIPNSQSLPSYNFEDVTSPRSTGPPSYLDIIDESNDTL